MPARGYKIRDETELFQRGRVKIVAEEVVRLLAIATPESENRLEYPFLGAHNAARERAVKAIQASLPKVKTAQDENPAKRRRETNLVARVPETLLALSQIDESDDVTRPLPGASYVASLPGASPVAPSEVADVIAASVRANPPLRPEPRLTVDELNEMLLSDEGVPFVDPSSERVYVTELLKRDDPRHSSPALSKCGARRSRT